MKYQIFTRQSVPGRPSRPRRVCVVDTIEAARAYCTAENDKRSKTKRRAHFFYEFANLEWYSEAFGR